MATCSSVLAWRLPGTEEPSGLPSMGSHRVGHDWSDLAAAAAAAVGKESACNAGDPSSIPGSGRSPGEGKGYPLQYSGLENSMDCIVCTKCWTWLNDFHFTFILNKFSTNRNHTKFCSRPPNTASFSLHDLWSIFKHGWPSMRKYPLYRF